MGQDATQPMSAPTGRGRCAIFTICSNNYLPFARVLFESVRRHHPDAELFLCLADRAEGLPGFYSRDWTVIEAQALPIPDFASFAFRYDIMEFNTALKPFMLLHLVEALGFDAVIYLDPDIELFAPLAPVLAALEGGASFVFTPHLCSPCEDRREPNDVAIMRAGTYNLGFLGVSRTDEAIDALWWWARRLQYQCVNAQAEGLFVDQKFMDLVPSFAPHAAICRDTALNVAYWNLLQRRLDRVGQGWTVDGAPLVFFHFSGFNPRDPGRLSKHDPRFVGDLPEPLRALTAHYAARLLAQGWGALPAPRYAYGQFASGTPIHPAIRKMFRDWHPLWAGDPFEEYEAYLREPWPGAARPAPGQAVSNFMRVLHASDPLLGQLDLGKPDEAARLIDWFLGEAAGLLQLDPALVQPATVMPVHRDATPPAAIEEEAEMSQPRDPTDADVTGLPGQLRQCRQVSQGMAADLARAKEEIAATRVRAAAFAGQVEGALLRVAELEAAVGQSQADHARLAAQLEAERQDRVAIRASDDAEASLRSEIETLRHHRDEAHLLRQSTSWRITRPLRALRRPGRALRVLLGKH